MRHTRKTLSALALLGALTTPVLPAEAAPGFKAPGRAIEGFAPYQPQTTCSPSAKPGTVALRSLIMSAYGGTGDYGIIRNCTLGGRSEHKEGRAWDWKVNVANAGQVRQVNDMLTWLLRTDSYGNRSAQARRLGLMYVIWNKRIWNARSNAWSVYTGADAHTNHVHFSLGWAGALKRTSYWTGVVSGVVGAPAAPRPTTPAPAPKPVGPQPLSGTATLTVSGANPKGVTSTFLVEAGRHYLVTSTGYYRYGAGNQLADAECSTQPDGSWQRSSAAEQDGTWTGERGHLDLQVEGQSTRWAAEEERCDDATHAYRTVIEPETTGPLTLRVVDSDYTDNGGGLRVTISPFSWGDRG